MKTRIEKDALGKFPVPADAYYGIFTARALKNFQLTGLRAPRVYIQALGLIKEACAAVNHDLGGLEKPLAEAIKKASREFGEGKFDAQFPLDPIQAGAGTPFNMNANEIIANRANEFLGQPLGSYDPVNPNDHVNMSQSSNDVTPTAIRIAALSLIGPLLHEIERLHDAFEKFANAHAHIIKVGRTHLEDAVPMTLGQEFHAYAAMLEKSRKRLAQTADELLEIGLGGTAVGTGITTHPLFRKKITEKLAALCRMPLRMAKDAFETTASMNSFVAVSGACRGIAIDLVKISNDLKLLNMGPNAGLAEITLPEVEPGSSIMPGKVNPSVCEAVHMAAFDVMASDHAVALAAQAGQLELNVMTPLIIKHLLGALQLLTNTCDMFRKDCVLGIKANEKNIARHVENSLITATALNPYLGYKIVAEIVKHAQAEGRSLVFIIRNLKLMEDRDLAAVLSPEKSTKPALVDENLRRRIHKNPAYQKFRESLK